MEGYPTSTAAMGLKRTTYEKAQQAIAGGDLAALQRLIAKDVLDEGPQRRRWMDDLVRQAARLGYAEMVTHLAQRAVLREDFCYQLAWAVALEAGQHDLAQGLLFAGGRTVPRFTGATRFTHACREHAWAAVSHLIDHEHHVPSDVDVSILFHELSTLEPESPCPERLLSLGYRAPSESLGDVLLVAMRAHRDRLFTETLARIDPSHLDFNMGTLLAQAVVSDRYDWARQLDQALQSPWTDYSWIDGVVNPALDAHRLGFIQEALADRPSLARHLQKHLTGCGPGKFFGCRLITWASDDQDPVLLDRGRQILRQVYPDDALDHVRAQVAGTLFQPEAALNRLAQWAPASVRDRWLIEDPVLFAPTLAAVRAAATDETPRPATTRPRRRA